MTLHLLQVILYNVEIDNVFSFISFDVLNLQVYKLSLTRYEFASGGEDSLSEKQKCF